MKRKNIVCIAMATTLSCTSIINSTSSITHAEEASNKLLYTKFTVEFKNGNEKFTGEIKISVKSGKSEEESRIETTKNGKIELNLDTRQEYKIKVADEDKNWTSETYNITFNDIGSSFDKPMYETLYTKGEFSYNDYSQVEPKVFDGLISIMKKTKKTEESEKSKENTGTQKVEDKQKSEIEQAAKKARDLIDQLEKLKKETNDFEVLEGLSDTQFADKKSEDGKIEYDGYMKNYNKEIFEKHVKDCVDKVDLKNLNDTTKKLEDTLIVGQIMLNHRLLNDLSKKYPKDNKIKTLLKALEDDVKSISLDGSGTDTLTKLRDRSKQKLDEAKKIDKEKKEQEEQQKKKEQEEQQRKKALEDQKKKEQETEKNKDINKDKKGNKKPDNQGNQGNKKVEDKQKNEKNNSIKKEEEKNKDTKQNDKNKINTKYIRIAGQDRIETSVQISKSKFKSSDTVIIASANNFPDALSASSLASLYKAPILLSNKDSISKSVIDEVSRLGAKNIIVVGGENSISENALSSLNKLKVERISGNNRYETSKKISEKVIEKGYNKALILVDGRNYPDALAASSLVAKNNGPILLVSDSNNEAKNNVEFAKSLNPSSILIVGGINSVSRNIENELKNPTRISGSDRYETSKKVANAILSKNSDIYVTTGKNYADAIASGPAVILDKAALILVDDNNSDIKDIKTKFTPSTINVIGGLNSISDRLLSKIK